MTDNTGYVNYRAVYARFEAHWKLTDWDIDDGGYHTLKRLLRLANIDHMAEEHIRICQLLCGPHGWTVYQMLQARMKHD